MTTSADERIAELEKQLQAANQKIAKLTAIIKLQQNQLYGKKTEVFETITKGQQSLFNEEQLSAMQGQGQSVTEVITVDRKQVVRHRKPKVSGKRAAFLDNLPQVNEVLPLADKRCPYCHKEMHKISQRLYSREATLKPAELYCRNLFQETYKCLQCHPEGKDVLVNSEAPRTLLPHSYFSSSILAKVCELKFNLALPFHRQLKLWTELGFPVDDKLIANNVIKVSEVYLQPLYEKLIELMRTERVIHMDETPISVLEEHKTNCYFWATRTVKEFSRHHLTVFHYFNTRSGKAIGEIMGSDYEGIIVCDGYGGYSDKLYPTANFGTCLVHIRREFTNIIKTLELKKAKHSVAQQAVNLLRPIFHTENQLEYQNPDEKLKQRQEKMRPLTDKFYDYISHVISPIGKLRNAIQNAINLRSRVYRIFENGEVPLTNNPVEQAIRPSTLIRKNSLFAKSIRGAKASAIYYTIVSTAKQNHLNIYKYFQYLFDYLPNRNGEAIEAYLPWAEQVQQECHI